MDVRKTYNALEGILAGFTGKLLSPTAVRLLRTQLREWARKALEDASYERMFYLRARDLRAMGGVLPSEFGDDCLIACRQTRDADGQGHVGLVIETTAALPGKHFFLENTRETHDPEAGPADGGTASEDSDGTVAGGEQT